MEQQWDRTEALRRLYLTGTSEALAAAADGLEAMLAELPAEPEPQALLAEVRCTQADTEEGDTPRRRALANEAGRLARTALAIAPSSLAARRAYGHTLLVSRRFDEAFRVLDRLRQDFPNDAEVQALRWRCHPQGRERCIPLLAEALEREPRLVRCFAEACYVIAGAHAPDDALPVALEFIDRVGFGVVAANPGNLFVSLGLAIVAMLLRNYGAAARWGRETYLQSQQYGDLACGVAAHLGRHFHGLGELALAVELFRVCHEIDPADCHNMLNELWCGITHAGVGGRARFLASTVLALAPKDRSLRPQLEAAARLLRETEDVATRGVLVKFHGAFLSYPQAIVDQVYAVVDRVHELGRPIRFFKDHASIPPGEFWAEALDDAIRAGCDAVVYFHTREADESPYIRAELAAAYAHLEPHRLIVVDVDGTYRANRGEQVLRLGPPKRTALDLADRLTALDRRRWILPDYTGRPKLSADILALRATQAEADALSQALAERGMLVLRRIIADATPAGPILPVVPGAATICLVTKESLADARWRGAAEVAYRRSVEWGDASFVPVLLDEARLPEPWDRVHALDVGRFQTSGAAVLVLAARLTGRDPADDIPDKLRPWKPPADQ